MSEKKKPSTPNKTGLIARATSSVADRARSTAIAARKGAKIVADSGAKAAIAGAELAKKGAVVVWSGAKQVKNQVDQKTRETLDAAYLTHQPAATKNVQRLRNEHAGSTPAEIIKILEREYFLAEVKRDQTPRILLNRRQPSYFP
jgi:hypothetical protein